MSTPPHHLRERLPWGGFRLCLPPAAAGGRGGASGARLVAGEALPLAGAVSAMRDYGAACQARAFALHVLPPEFHVHLTCTFG